MSKEKKTISLVKNNLNVIMSEPKQRKISSVRTCMCHMVREMGDCSLNEVVKQYKKNML